ncbi:glycogen-binding subunit 76A [Scaptodrosophila lebanonensis]|uniref:Glycogen-binding subunit 76A n=1 Tax=Drosophila lebanonensis TaxID=7225 RepID=A0A6J2U419_DROLE|nr:glycogen-binding subunit 76A [Scaptodrosophila lebanonensis]XP_030382668.1 glycogen-binding subunit 76A [Scaptodrosophila lebanonensis]XP_030382675.1 glycogen-binding subunit 76A [Scaptodrosophila lebanonensis]
MSEPGDLPLTHSSTPDSRPPCSIISIIPTIGMSSCRGRAEAFARSLSSKLRTLGSQTNEEGASAEDEPIINGTNTNTWVNPNESKQTVTDLQPLRHESDSFFDFDCELESPGSPVDECEYLRLIETASNTPHNSTAVSGYACASAASSHSSTDGPYFDAPSGATASTTTADQLTVTTQQPHRSKLPPVELNEFVNALQLNGAPELLTNGGLEAHEQPAIGEEIEKSATQTEAETKAETEAEAENVVVEDEIDLQAQILSELQQQSDDYINSGNGDINIPISEQAEVQEEELTAADSRHTEQQPIQENVIVSPTTSTTNKEQLGEDETDKNYSMQLTVDVNIAQLEQGNVDVAEPSSAPEKMTHSHGIDTTDDEDDCRPQRVRRCSSLKTGKTPPGTPGRKKIVRFADVLGLDLADVKTFLDEIPNIPKSAFEDLEILDSEPPLQLGPKSDKLLMPLFQQPGGLPTFLDAVREKQVSLENAAVTDNINQTIAGSVRVRNLDFHKSVHVRYSLDGWRSYADLQANYVENSCDGFSDKFTFVLFGNSLHVGQRLEFAVRFQCKGQQFWDNNYGANYCFQCLPTSNHLTSTTPVAGGPVPAHLTSNLVGMLSPTVGDTWCSSFY